MARNRLKAKGRREHGSFLALPLVVIDSKEFSSLSAYAVKLIIDLYAQFKGSNNGDLCAAWSMMKKRGWRSKGTLHRALNELREKGFLLLARQGGKHKASLYALSFLAVDECKGKLEIPPTAAPPGTWRKRNVKTESLPRMCTNVPRMSTNHENIQA